MGRFGGNSVSMAWVHPGDQHVCGLEQQRAHRAVAALGYSARVVDLAGLISSRREAEIGADIGRPGKPASIIDGGDEVERCNRPDDGGISMERRLAAILAVDVVGYTRLMGADDAWSSFSATNSVSRP
jgi:hypothetical protein